MMFYSFLASDIILIVKVSMLSISITLIILFVEKHKPTKSFLTSNWPLIALVRVDVHCYHMQQLPSTGNHRC